MTTRSCVSCDTLMVNVHRARFWCEDCLLAGRAVRDVECMMCGVGVRQSATLRQGRMTWPAKRCKPCHSEREAARLREKTQQRREEAWGVPVNHRVRVARTIAQDGLRVAEMLYGAPIVARVLHDGELRMIADGATMVLSSRSQYESNQDHKLEQQAEPACYDPKDPPDFFPPASELTEAAERLWDDYCSGCPVREACAKHAIAHEEHGIWAGLTPAQRSQIRGRRERTEQTLKDIREGRKP